MILSIRLNNIKKHKNLHINLEGKSIALIGDSGVGKSTVMDIIRASIGMIDFPKDALTAGEADGAVEVQYKDAVTSRIYTIQRRFSKGKLLRYDMRTEENAKLNWEDEIKLLFNGVDPKVSYFDYSEFFFQQKTPDSRFEYAMKCVLGELYIENVKKIESLEKERGVQGTKKKLLESRLVNCEITEANYDSLVLIYANPQTTELAIQQRDSLLNTRPKIQEIVGDLSAIQKNNARHEELQGYIDNIREVVGPEIEREQFELLEAKGFIEHYLGMPANNEKMKEYMQPLLKNSNITPLKLLLLEQLNSLVSSYDAIIYRLSELSNQIKEIEMTLSDYERQQSMYPLDWEKEASLQLKFDNVTIDSNKIEREAQSAYDAAIEVVDTFNSERALYLSKKADYDDLQVAMGEWIKKDNEIKDIRLENIRAFKDRVPFEGLEIKDIVTEKKEGSQKIDVVKQRLFYKGRELNFDNVSKGESLQIAFQFQTIHNPRFKVVFIPEAQSLGSKFDELAIAAKEEGYQWIAEFTERKKEFTMKFEEEII